MYLRCTDPHAFHAVVALKLNTEDKHRSGFDLRDPSGNLAYRAQDKSPKKVAWEYDRIIF